MYNNAKKTMFNFRCQRSLAAAVGEAAGKAMLSKSDYAREAIKRALDRDGITLDQQAETA